MLGDVMYSQGMVGKIFGATSEYPATDTPSLNLQVRGWINIKLSATVVRSVLLKCYRGPQSRSGWISYGVSV